MPQLNHCPIVRHLGNPTPPLFIFAVRKLQQTFLYVSSSVMYKCFSSTLSGVKLLARGYVYVYLYAIQTHSSPKLVISFQRRIIKCEGIQ